MVISKAARHVVRVAAGALFPVSCIPQIPQWKPSSRWFTSGPKTNPGESPLVLRLQLPDLSKAVDLELKETVKPTLEAPDGLNRLGIPLPLN